MRKVVQKGAIVAGACGLVLTGAAPSFAKPSAPTAPAAPVRSLLATAVGADLATVTGMASGVICRNNLVEYNYKSPVIKSPNPCINGPVHSGNSVNSGNFINRGNPNNSGNLESTNGSTNAANSVSGSKSNSDNNVSY